MTMSAYAQYDDIYGEVKKSEKSEKRSRCSYGSAMPIKTYKVEKPAPKPRKKRIVGELNDTAKMIEAISNAYMVVACSPYTLVDIEYMDTLYVKGSTMSKLPMPEENLQVVIDRETGNMTFRLVNYNDYKFIAEIPNKDEYELLDQDSAFVWIEKSRKPVYKTKDVLHWRSGYEKIVTNGKTYYAYTDNIPQWRKEKVHDYDIVHYSKKFLTKEEMLEQSASKGYKLNEFQYLLYNNGFDWRPKEPVKLTCTDGKVVITMDELTNNLNFLESFLTEI